MFEVKSTDTIETLNSLPFDKIYIGQTKRNDWECDQWVIKIAGQTFDYFTGLGHRKLKKNAFPEPKCSKRSIYYAEWAKVNIVPVPPDNAGILYGLALDSSALEYSFEDWCSEYGYDSDSRKAHATYEACIDNARKMLKCFSKQSIQNIQEILQDY